MLVLLAILTLSILPIKDCSCGLLKKSEIVCATQECRFYNELQLNHGTRIEKLEDDLIRGNGYPFESYNITSSDGYISTIFRIPNGRTNERNNGKRFPVLLHHGFIADGWQWVLNRPDKALGYRLADAGYDVWIINNRGTFHSLDHTYLSWKTKPYWDFSFHEIALYDVPEIINLILKTTNHSQLFYVGHSMGCSTFLAAMSLHPNLNSKIKAFFALAPAVYIGNTVAPFQPIRPILLNNQGTLDSLLNGPFVTPNIMQLMPFIGYLCTPKLISRWICFGTLETVFGYNFMTNEYDLRKEIIAFGLSSTSLKTLFHLMQLWKSGKFQQYDYLDKNLQVYGSQTPFLYELDKVTAEVHIVCAAEDQLVTCRDAEELSKALPNVKDFRRIEQNNFNHIDFLYAENINSLLNDRIINTMNDIVSS